MLIRLGGRRLLLSCKYRLYPTRAQGAALDGMLHAFRDLYDAALQQRIEAYRRRGVSLTYHAQADELRAVRAADERLAGFSYSAEQQVLRRLDKAFRAFFRRLKAGEKPGFPRFKGRDRFHAAEFRVGDGLTLRKTGRLGVVGLQGRSGRRRPDLGPPPSPPGSTRAAPRSRADVDPGMFSPMGRQA